MKYIIPLIFCLFLLSSCQGDDDVCLSGEATPRMKVKFKTSGKVTTLDSLYVDVDYGSGAVNIITQASADSALIPLRVDENPYTEIYVRKRKYGSKSKFKVSYTLQSVYVSPACGFKRLYQNIAGTLETANPVLSIEKNQDQIINETNTHFYLAF